MIRVLAVLAMLTSATLAGIASNPPPPELVASIDLSQLLADPQDVSPQSIAFVSDTSIAVGLCPNGSATGCTLSLLHRQGDILRFYASTSHFSPGMSVHASREGQILAIPVGMSPAVLFAADLSEAQDLPSLNVASQSGNIAAQFVPKGWKLFRVEPKIEFIREGSGSLRSLSDEVVVFQDSNVMHIETLQGSSVGSFSVRPEKKCNNSAYPLSANELYLSDCKRIRIVNFNGRVQTELRTPQGWSSGLSWSNDGKRILFHQFDRKISPVRNAGEIFVMFATLGMGVADELDNREEVLVMDAATGGVCFDWKRSFPEGSVGITQDAAISGSGKFVGIAAGGTLSLYRLPEICTPSK